MLPGRDSLAGRTVRAAGDAGAGDRAPAPAAGAAAGSYLDAVSTATTTTKTTAAAAATVVLRLRDLRRREAARASLLVARGSRGAVCMRARDPSRMASWVDGVSIAARAESSVHR